METATSPTISANVAGSTEHRNVTEGQAEIPASSTRASSQDQSHASADDEDDDVGSLERFQSRVHRPQSALHETAFVFILISAQFMTQATFAQAIVPISILADSFGITNPGRESWFAASFSLTVGTFIMIAGRLGDIYGHKQLFVAGYVWFAVWSLVTGFSVYTNDIFYDFCRAMQGIGPAFLLPNAIAILGRTYENGRRKEVIFSLLGATAPSGFVVGALFTSLLSERVWWPWSYWILAIVCTLFTIGAILILPSTPRPPPDRSLSVWQRTDIIGCITGVSALILINAAWNQAPVVGWTTPYTYIILIIGFLFFGAFFYNESIAAFPLLPIRALKADAAFVLGCIACGWGAFGIWVYYSWRFVENLRDLSPLLATAQFSPVCVAGIVAAGVTALSLSRISPSFIMLGAMVAFTVGTILVATMPIEQIYWAQLFVATLVAPFGMDMSFPAATIILSNALPRQHQGAAASLVNTVVNYSISIALGMAGTVEVYTHGGATSKEDVLAGYRAAFYFGIGIAGLGVLVGIAYVLYSFREMRRDSVENDVAAGGHDEKESD